jgi:mono/diheme cytochrome c family protein
MRGARMLLASTPFLFALPTTLAGQMGSAVYAATCAECHDEANNPRTPQRSTLATLTPIEN